MLINRRAWPSLAVLILISSAVANAQTRDTITYPEPMLGIRLGSSRQATIKYLTSSGWTVVSDSVPAEVGSPALFAGSIDGHPAEIVGMFSQTPGTDRLLTTIMNFPVADERALASTYAWAYRRMEKLRCHADLPHSYDHQLDSILNRGRASVPKASNVPLRHAVLPGHTTLEPGNVDWPFPSWMSAEALLATRLTAGVLASDSRWPYEVSLWSSSFLTQSGDATMCPDTKATIARAQPPRVVRPGAPGERPIMDTLLIVAAAGVTGQVGTTHIDTKARSVKDGEQVFRLAAPRATNVAYSVAAATGFDNLLVVVDSDLVDAEGSITLEGNHSIMFGADKQAVVTPATKTLVELMRKELTATDILSAYVDVGCEIERMRTITTDSAWSVQIAEAERIAFDSVRDRKALKRIDDALAGHVFGMCAQNRARYQKR